MKTREKSEQLKLKCKTKPWQTMYTHTHIELSNMWDRGAAISHGVRGINSLVHPPCQAWGRALQQTLQHTCAWKSVKIPEEVRS